MIPVPWSASHEGDDSAEAVRRVQNRLAPTSLLPQSSASSSRGGGTYDPSSHVKANEDMSVYLQHFLSVHSRVHLKRQGSAASAHMVASVTPAQRGGQQPRAQLRHTSTDTVRTEPPAQSIAPSYNRILSPSTADYNIMEPPKGGLSFVDQNFVSADLRAATNDDASARAQMTSKSPLAATGTLHTSRLPKSLEISERVRAHTTGRTGIPHVTAKTPVLRRPRGGEERLTEEPLPTRRESTDLRERKGPRVPKETNMSAPRASTAPGVANRHADVVSSPVTQSTTGINSRRANGEKTSTVRTQLLASGSRVRTDAPTISRSTMNHPPRPMPPAQALQVTNSSSAWSSATSHPPRPRRGNDPPMSYRPGLSNCGSESAIGLRRRLGVVKQVAEQGPKPPQLHECVDEAKDASPSESNAILAPSRKQSDAPAAIEDAMAARLLNDKAQVRSPCNSSFTGMSGRIGDVEVTSARAAMSHNLAERRRRIIQPTVHMELLTGSPDQRRPIYAAGDADAQGSTRDRGSLISNNSGPPIRSMNLTSRRLAGSMNANPALLAVGSLPQTCYRFQQVGSNMPPGGGSPNPAANRPSELLRRVIKEVGYETILDGDQLELLMSTGRYVRLGELLRLGLRRDDLIRGAYRINSGTFCSVFLGRWQGRDVAIKSPHPALLESDPLMMTHRAIAEWKILSQIDQPHIVKLIGGIVIEEERTIWLITEYIHGGDVYNFLYHQRSTEANSNFHGYRRLKLMEQLAEGLSYLHARRVVHKDIKCNNLLITAKDVLKICDFGDAEVLTGVHIQCCTAATWQYVSPELICSNDPARPIGATELVDVWAMGCVFLEMIKCPTPFFHLLEHVPENQQRDRLRQLYLQGVLEAEMSIPRTLPPKLKSLITRCLQYHASKRNTSHQILHYIRMHQGRLQSEIDLWINNCTAVAFMTSMKPLPAINDNNYPSGTHFRPSYGAGVSTTTSPGALPLWPTIRPRATAPQQSLSPRIMQQPIYMAEKYF